MKNKLLLFFCLICYIIQAQPNKWLGKADSIERIIAINPSYETLENYTSLGIRVMHMSPESFTRFEQKLTDGGEKTDWPYLNARILSLRLVISIDESKFDSSLLQLNKLYDIAIDKKDTVALIHYYMNSGIILKRQSRFDRAIDMYYKGLALANITRFEQYQLSFYNNLGSLYNSTEDYQSAKKVISEAIKIFYKTNDEGTVGLGSLYGNLAVAYKRTNNLDSALYYYEKSRVELEMVNNVSVSGVYCNIGILYGSLKQYDMAEQYLQKALDLTRKYKQANFEVNVLNALSDIRGEQGNYKEAIAFSQQALVIAQAKGMLDAAHRSLEYQREAYAALGDYTMAYKMFVESTAMRDSIYNIEKEQVAREVKERYETDRKDDEIRLANKSISEQRKRSYFLVITIISFALLMVYIGFLYFRTGRLNKQIEAQSKAMEVQNKKLENANQVKEKLFAVVSHDLRAPVNSLHSFLILMNKPNLGEEKLNALKQELQKQLTQTTGLMENLLHWAKTQMKGWEVKIKAIPVNKSTEKVQEQLIELANHKSISLDLETRDDLKVAADEQLLQIILHNIVSNAIKFTPEYGKVWLETEIIPNKVVIKICDTGKGMSQDTIEALMDESVYRSTKGTSNEKGFGFGLKICIELLKQMNGSLHITSREREGSGISIILPAGQGL